MSTDSRVDFPLPDAPVTATNSPGRMRAWDSSRLRDVRPSWRTTTPSTTSSARRRSGGGTAPSCRSCSSRASRPAVASAPSVLSWNMAPSRLIGANASGASSRTNSAGPSARCPSTTRRPTLTATSATARVENSSRTKDDRNASRNARTDSRRCRSPTSRRPTSWRRPNTLSTVKPSRTSEKCRPRRSSACQRRSIRSLVTRPTSTRNTIVSGRVTPMITADRTSCEKIATRTMGGTSADRTICGRKRPM